MANAEYFMSGIKGICNIIGKKNSIDTQKLMT